MNQDQPDAGFEPAPSRIGEFRVIRPLGRGAMGRVFLAEQDEPRREVALKLLRTAAPPEHQWRFRREAELLAALEHPGIARVYAVGAVEQAPYLAMEFVRGADLCSHAEQHKLSTEQRLRLLASVCRAVHYAHTRGVVHRDLKPANILVDEHGQPKVLDFGVAHVIREDITQMTGAGEVLGTIPYMAPEQLSGEPGAVDPRSDVYALGVSAYQLVAGELPYPGLSGATLISALKILLHEAPQRLSRSAPQARGDVETVVMKAMAREPSRRYASAAELAADIERLLAHRPVEARPPTTAYLLRLFLRRHRVLSAAGALVLLALVTAVAVSTGFALQARQRLAERDAVNGFLVNMLTLADPEHSLGERLTVRDALDAARRELEFDAALSPQAVTQLRRTLGNTYVSLGLPHQGLEQLELALAEVEQRSGADSEQARRLAIELAHALAQAGREAEAVEQLQVLLDTLGAAPEHAQLRIAARLELGAIIDLQGRLREAEGLLRAALAEADAVLGRGDPTSLRIAHFLALSLHRQARFAESLALSEEVVRRSESRLGAEHPRSLSAREVVALNKRELGELDQAEAIYRQVLEVRERQFGDEHLQTQETRVSLAGVLALADRAGEAVPYARSAHAAVLKKLGPDAELTRNIASLRAYVVSAAGHWDESAQIYRGLIAQAERNPDGPTATDLPDYNNLANALVKLERLDEARQVFERLMSLAEARVGREHTHYALYQNNYAECLRLLGEHQAARRGFEHALAVLQRELGPTHARTRLVGERLLATYRALGLSREAQAIEAALR